MLNSIRLRLLLWYAIVLCAIIGGFAYLMYDDVRTARYAEVDAEIIGAANYIDSTLRQFPPFELDFRMPKGPKKDREFGKGPPPPPKWQPLEQLMANLPPPSWPTKDDGSGRYFWIQRSDNSYIMKVNYSADYGPYPTSGMTSTPAIHIEPGRHHATCLGPFQTRIHVGCSLDTIDSQLNQFARKLFVVGSCLLIIGLLGGWVISSRMIRPLKRISSSASRISADNLSERIDTARVETELLPLAEVLNDAFSRLQTTFEQLTRFTADASHELRTPLAIIKANVELALLRPRSTDEYRETLQTCLQSIVRLTQLVEGLLTLARADAGQWVPRQDTVNLDVVVNDVAQQLKPFADAGQVLIKTDVSAVDVIGDEATLSRVVMNLVENAIRYNHPGGHVRLYLGTKDDDAILKVTDTGSGIPEEDQPRVFERFFRADKARSRDIGGNGLGLAICKSIIDAHHGTITFISHPGDGTTFRVKLPRKRPSAS